MESRPNANMAKSLAQEGLGLLKDASYGAALEAFSEAARLYAETGDIANETIQKMIVADIYCVSGQQDKALATYQQVLFRLCGANDMAAMAATQNNIGLLLTRMQRYDEATTAFNDAMQAFEQCGQPERVAEQLANLGSVCRDKREYVEARDYYQQAQTIFEQCGASDKIADQHANIGYIHIMLGDKNAGLAHFEQAKLLYEQTGNIAKVRNTVKNIELIKAQTKDPSCRV